MLGIHTSLGDFSVIEILCYVTMLQLWWIAIWGIAYIVIEYVSNKSKLTELYIYCGLLALSIAILVANPHLIHHL
jgi:hypothetical protein